MPTEWYYAEGDEQLGPVSQKELEELISTGELGPDTHVWNKSLPGWSVAGLYPLFMVVLVVDSSVFVCMTCLSLDGRKVTATP